MVYSNSCIGKVIFNHRLTQINTDKLFKKIFYYSVFISVYLWLFLSMLSGAFNELGMGAYPVSMGEAFVSIPGDINGIYYNPASLGYMKGVQVSDSFQLLYPGLENDKIYYNNFSLGMNVHPVGSLGLAWTSLFSQLYNENALYLSYSIKAINLGFGRFTMGVTPKILSKSYAHNEYTETDSFFQQYGFGKKGFGLDAGLLYEISSLWHIGLSVANIITPDLELSTGSSVKRLFRIGGSWNPEYPFTIKSKFISQLRISTDFVVSEDIFKVLIGTDIEIYRFINFMLGFNIGNNDYRRFTTGLGYLLKLNKMGIRINYGFIFGLNEVSAGTYGNHIVSLRLEI